MSNFLWKIEGVEMSAGRGTKRLCVDSLQIPSGITAIVGHSGSGKTTLLNLLVGFEKAEKGAVLRNITRGGFRTELFWAPHNGGLWPHLSVAEHLAAVGGVRDAFLAEFGLEDKMARRPGELSRGECARLSIVRALAADPAVLVFDEPLVNIDGSRRRRNWRNIVKHVRESGKSLIYSTHSPSHIMGSADTVICISGGCVAYAGPVGSLYLDPPNAELAAYLGQTNWFEPEDARFWLAKESPRGFSVRPEHLGICPNPDGAFKVAGCEFDGTLLALDLFSPGTDRSMTVYARSGGNDPKAGDMVSLCSKRSEQ